MLERGAKCVIIWDINRESIDNTIAELSLLGSIIGFSANISKKEDVKIAADATKEAVGCVDIIVNNAGIVVGKSFVDHTLSDIDNIMNVNTLGAMYISYEFLSSMVDRNSGHICNIASSAGLVGNPNMSVYAASKWAVVGWSESVRLELVKKKSNVKVTTILPYYINTGMFDGVKSRIPILKPEKAAESIVRAIEKNSVMTTLPGYLYFLTRTIQGLMPKFMFDFMAGKVFGIYNSMNDFVGRK